MRPPLFGENTTNSHLLTAGLAFYGEFSDPVDFCNDCWYCFGYGVMVADRVGGTW